MLLRGQIIIAKVTLERAPGQKTVLPTDCHGQIHNHFNFCFHFSRMEVDRTRLNFAIIIENKHRANTIFITLKLYEHTNATAVDLE